MIFPQMTTFDLENVLKSLENGPKLMIMAVQNRQNYAEKVYHFYLVRVETPPEHTRNHAKVRFRQFPNFFFEILFFENV